MPAKRPPSYLLLLLALALALALTSLLSVSVSVTLAAAHPGPDTQQRGRLSHARTRALAQRQGAEKAQNASATDAATSGDSTGTGNATGTGTAPGDDAPPDPAAAQAATDKYEGSTYTPSANGLPNTTQPGQVGTNNCGVGVKEDSMCQNGYFNSITDWCAFTPQKSALVSDVETEVVSSCTLRGRGTRGLSPHGLQGATFVTTPSYVQLTAVGDFTAWNVAPADDGGELDPHGATGLGNPIGGLMFHCGKDKGCVQAHEWMEFLSYNEYCKRVCFDGDKAQVLCQHVYDTEGCSFNMPGTYTPGLFQSCESDDAPDVSLYNGTKFLPGTQPVPEPHPAPELRNCKNVTLEEMFGVIEGGDPFGPTGQLKVRKLSKEEVDASTPVSSGSTTADAGAGKNATAGGTGALDGGVSGSNGTARNNLTSAATSSNGSATGASTNGGSTVVPNGGEAPLSVEASRRLGWALGAVVLGLVGGCVLL